MATPLWTDKRSGTAGRLAGNVVLNELLRDDDAIKPRKGVTFESDAVIYVARTCGSSSYLQPPIVHWSTASPREHREVTDEANESGRAIFYLFITATPDTAGIDYWKVPGDVVTQLLATAPRRAKDDACMARIRVKDGQHYLGSQAVTQFHHVVKLSGEQRRALRDAFEVDRRTDRGTELKSDRVPSPVFVPRPAPIGSSDVVRLTGDGTLVLPERIRTRFQLVEGSNAVVSVEDDRIVIQPVRLSKFSRFRGTLKGSGALAALNEERQREREL